jgi:phospholipid-binding lipoprotein MlaA
LNPRPLPRRFLTTACLGFLLLVAACAGAPPPAPAPAGPAAVNEPAAPAPSKPEAEKKTAIPDSNDPFEGFNRAMYAFNDWFDRNILKPVAKGYRAVLPSPIRTGIGNFFSNLREPIVILNDLFQGKFGQALSDTGRFLVNTTVGIGGLLDPATHLGMRRHNEDFGQTLAVWGVGEGPYIVWPFLGPSNLRDTAGLAVDWQVYPPNRLEEASTRDKLLVLEVVELRSQLLDASDILEQAAGQDPYTFVREAHRLRRRNLIHDGNPPKTVPKGLFEDDDPPPRPKPPAAEPVKP